MDYAEYDVDEDILDGNDDVENIDEISADINEEVDECERRGLLENLENEDLFKENDEGDYKYLEGENGKSAWGNLALTDEGIRNSYAQRMAGGEFREAMDDGGHLIGTRFGGSPELENIDAQNRNLNRGGYKTLENSWASSLEDGNKVFVNVDTYKTSPEGRPSAYMGYAITEDADGKRSWDAFSYTNVSSEEQAEWEEFDKETED